MNMNKIELLTNVRLGKPTSTSRRRRKKLSFRAWLALALVGAVAVNVTYYILAH